MRTIAFSDLDRTLIYSAAAAGLEPGTIERLAVCVEVFEGRPQSWVTRGADTTIRALIESGLLVPLTTRTIAQTRRIEGPFAGAGLVLCANGGRLLRDGVEDTGFTAAIATTLEGAGAPLVEVEALLRARLAAVPGAGPLRIADGLFAYTVCTDRAAAEQGRTAIEADLAAHGWRSSVQGRKLYAVPAALTKAAAAARLARELGADRIVAAGDSLLDADVLAAADAAIRPAHGELEETGLRLPNLTVTAATGIAAGEEIAAWLHAQVLDGPAPTWQDPHPPEREVPIPVPTSRNV